MSPVFFNFFDGSISSRTITNSSLAAAVHTIEEVDGAYMNGSYVIKFHGIHDGCADLSGKRFMLFQYEYHGVEYSRGYYAVELL